MTDVAEHQTDTDEAPRSAPDLSDPGLFINRELSWLDFNDRVLQLAEDEHLPVMERVKFLAIYVTNLDEFFQDPSRRRARPDRCPRRCARTGRPDSCRGAARDS